MKPWAQWLINHNLKVLLFILAGVLFPAYFFMYIEPFIGDAWRAFKCDLNAVRKARKK